MMGTAGGTQRARVTTIRVAMVAAVLSACGADDTSGGGGGTAAPVLLSTDVAMGLTSGRGNGVSAAPPDVDDAWAFALAVDHPAVDLRGVAVTMGNGPVVPETQIARQTAEVIEATVSIAQGAATWLSVEPLVDYTGTNLDPTCDNDGVALMTEQLRAADRTTILAIGPLTDIACVLLRNPSLVDRIDRVVSLIGNLDGNPATVNGSVAGDFNYAMDPRAVDHLLNATDVEFVAITMNLAASALMPLSTIYALAESDDSRARYFGESSIPYADYYAQAVGPEKPIWDAVAAWHLIDPASQVCESMGYRGDSGAPGVYSNTDTGLWFGRNLDSPRQVTVCTAFASTSEADAFLDAAIAAVGG